MCAGTLLIHALAAQVADAVIAVDTTSPRAASSRANRSAAQGENIGVRSRKLVVDAGKTLRRSRCLVSTRHTFALTATAPRGEIPRCVNTWPEIGRLNG